MLPLMLKKKGLPSEEYNILPGYSAIKNLSPNEAVQMPYNSKITKVKAPIISITLDIVTSKRISKSEVKAAKKILTKTLMIDEERGDIINIVFEKFPIHVAQDEEGEVKVGLPIEAKLMIVVLIITSIFLIMYILLQIKQLGINKESLKAAQETAKATAAAGASKPSSAGSDSPSMDALVGQGTDQGSDESGYFSFVHPSNANQFVGLVVKKEFEVDQLVVILSYVSPAISNAVLSQLDDAKQVSVIGALAEEKIGDHAMIEKLNNELKLELECSLGGTDKLGHIIATFSNNQKKTYLASLESNADIYAKIRPAILLFDDIEKLDDADVKKLIGAVNLEVLGTSIAGDENSVTQKLTSNLTGAAKAMITQFIDLKKDTLTQADIESAQNDVVAHLKMLSDEGKIDVISKVLG